jgi:putative DNA primase/helicase
MSNLDQFRAAMLGHGLKPPLDIQPGALHRFASNGKAGDTAGWCKLFEDQRGGAFGDWREGWQQTWQADRGRLMTAQEREAFRRDAQEAAQQRAAEAIAEQTAAAVRATTLWQTAPAAASDHPYLVAKCVKPHGLRVHEGALVVPIRGGAELHSLQFIASDGAKRFLTGGKVSGGYYGIGRPDGALCIAEGFATAASIHESSGIAVAVAFNAGNLLPVAQAMRARFPTLRLTICADDDAGTADNPGMTKARAAAEAVSGYLAVPDFGKDRPAGTTDFNDLARHAGTEAVARCIERAELLQRPDGGSDKPRAILTRGDAITPEPIAWLWPEWLAAGKLHILAGSPGTGKTTLALALAAAITCGGRWPDRTPAELGSVVMWSGEDDPKDVLIPRLLAMGADTSRVHIVSGITGPGGRAPYDPARDTSLLAEALRDVPDVRLLIVDPIVSAVSGDSHHNAETRRSLQPLVDLAAERRCALLGITHLSKGTAGREPVERVTGSLAFGALARVVLMAFCEQPEEGAPARRLFIRAKSNIGPDTGGYAYEVRQDALPSHPDILASSVLWGSAVEGTARELMAVAEQATDEPVADADAADFLRGLLADGPRAAKSIYADAEGGGYSKDAMKRAKNRVGASARKQGMAGGWMWHLPEERSEGREGSTLERPHSSHSSAHVAADDELEGVRL